MHRWNTSTLSWEKYTGVAAGLTADVNVTNASLPVTQSGTWNITNVSGTVSLPTGAATESTLEFGSVFFGDTIRYYELTQTSTTDTHNFYDSNGGTLVARLVITYTDSTKETIDSIERTV